MILPQYEKYSFSAPHFPLPPYEQVFLNSLVFLHSTPIYDVYLATICFIIFQKVTLPHINIWIPLFSLLFQCGALFPPTDFFQKNHLQYFYKIFLCSKPDFFLWTTFSQIFVVPRGTSWTPTPLYIFNFQKTTSIILFFFYICKILAIHQHFECIKCIWWIVQINKSHIFLIFHWFFSFRFIL